ncbi:hypothetical protein CT0861_10984 [Colletotrichum tofieldiae]|uniref:Antibiotic biosynthesis monooxygenase n=1 Tax=Colletotrichum tofieldiae TaxID=708197 RepID=A0A166N5Q4_9PEZI|nr:hypothetical protein CT0861_10984 [Colletotrichum tofieldiae]
MSTQPIDQTVVIPPNPGKADKASTPGWPAVCLRCLPHQAAPDTLRCEVHRGFKDENGDLEEFVVTETYVNEEALNQCMGGPDVLALAEATESGELIESVKVVDGKPDAE